MSQQQTILRVQTNKIKDNFVSNGTFDFDDSTSYGLTYTGSGTTDNPYIFETVVEGILPYAIGIGRFDFTGGQGVVNFTIFGEDDKLSSISVVYQSNYDYNFVFKEEYGSFAG